MTEQQIPKLAAVIVEHQSGLATLPTEDAQWAIQHGKETVALLVRAIQNRLFIDCDADPFLPKGWRVEQHLKSGSFKWDPTEVELYLDAGQKDGKVISGHELRKKLEGKRVLNANVLDWLLAHPQFIPESWKGKFVFFWGTIYRGGRGHLCVRYLCWRGSGWSWNDGWLVDYFRGLDPAALCK